MALIFARLANAVELQGQRALLVRGVILVQNTLSSSLIDRLHCDLVSALGLGAIAFSGSRLELLECGLQCGLVSLVAGVTHLSELDALLGRLNIRQTKHLLRLGFDGEHKKSTVQNGILTKFSRNCKHFFQIFSTFLYASKFRGHNESNIQDLVEGRRFYERTADGPGAGGARAVPRAALLSIILAMFTIVLLTVLSAYERKGHYLSVSKTKARL